MPSSNRLVAAIQRTGFPTDLAAGFLAVVVFVIGDGIEAVWITNYLSSDAVGFSVPQASTIITSYGVVVALAAFLSGALCDALGCRKVMLIGLISFLIFDALFIAVGLPSHNMHLLLLFYWVNKWLSYNQSPGVWVYSILNIALIIFFTSL